MPKQIQLHRFTGISGLQLDEVPYREPAAGEVRIQVAAFALNFGDLSLFNDEYVFTVELPTPIGDEAVGIIDAVGPEVTKFRIGDYVSTLPYENEGYQVSGESVVVPERFVVHAPKNLTDAEGCSIWVQYLTAYYALLELSDVTKEDWILITAGASSAGLGALDLCRMQGLQTIATTRSQKQVDFLLEAGATKVIVTDETFAQQLMEATGGKGVKSVYDPVGDPLLAQYANALAMHAQIFLYGNMDPRPDIVPVIQMNHTAAILRSYSVYQHIHDEVQRERGVNFIRDALERGDIKPRIDKVFPLERFMEAFEYQEKAVGRRGKLVITT